MEYGHQEQGYRVSREGRFLIIFLFVYLHCFIHYRKHELLLQFSREIWFKKRQKITPEVSRRGSKVEKWKEVGLKESKDKREAEMALMCVASSCKISQHSHTEHEWILSRDPCLTIYVYSTFITCQNDLQTVSIWLMKERIHFLLKISYTSRSL